MCFKRESVCEPGAVDLARIDKPVEESITRTRGQVLTTAGQLRVQQTEAYHGVSVTEINGLNGGEPET
jgi:hypothetical protein